jgi:hypothetical protein
MRTFCEIIQRNFQSRKKDVGIFAHISFCEMQKIPWHTCIILFRGRFRKHELNIFVKMLGYLRLTLSVLSAHGRGWRQEEDDGTGVQGS